MNNADKLADAMRVLLTAYSAAVHSDEKVGEDMEELCARQALEAFEARTFANDCHDMADRCAAILRNDDERRRTGQYERLRDADRTALLRLRAYAHGVGDEAECSPEAFEVKP